jgi:hypothetical protein
LFEHSNTSSESLKNGRIDFYRKLIISFENAIIFINSDGGLASSGVYKNFISYMNSLFGE